MGAQGVSPPVDRPLRMCIGCRRRSQQRQLLRFAIDGDAIVADADQRLPGRGAYLCRRRECAALVFRDGRRLVRALRTTRDRVTVDTAALLQDWEAHHRTGRGGTDTRTYTRGDERRRPRGGSPVGDGT